MIFLKNFFKNKSVYTLEYNTLIEKRNLLEKSNQTLEYQKVKSKLVYYEAVYDHHLAEVIKYTPDSLGNCKYEFRHVHPDNVFMIDNDIKSKAELTTNKLIKKKELQLPGILDLDNPIHYIFACRISDRFEAVVRKYGLDNYSLEKNGVTQIEYHIEKNLLDYKGTIYNALIFLKDYQNSWRKDKNSAVDGDYSDELIEKLYRFK